MTDVRLDRVNCYNCGRFVGRDGNLDLSAAVIPTDGWEPECARCIEKRPAPSHPLPPTP